MLVEDLLGAESQSQRLILMIAQGEMRDDDSGRIYERERRVLAHLRVPCRLLGGVLSYSVFVFPLQLYEIDASGSGMALDSCSESSSL